MTSKAVFIFNMECVKCLQYTRNKLSEAGKTLVLNTPSTLAHSSVKSREYNFCPYLHRRERKTDFPFSLFCIYFSIHLWSENVFLCCCWRKRLLTLTSTWPTKRYGNANIHCTFIKSKYVMDTIYLYLPKEHLVENLLGELGLQSVALHYM